MDWADVRESLILKARTTRKDLMKGFDDFDALRKELQFNYVLDEARKYLSGSETPAMQPQCQNLTNQGQIVGTPVAYAVPLRQQLQAAQQQVIENDKSAGAWQARAEKAEAELAALKSAGEGWIPCAERLPEPNGQINSDPMWLWCSTSGPEIGAYLWLTKWWIDRYGNAIENVTHWRRPLPPAPAKEGK